MKLTVWSASVSVIAGTEIVRPAVSSLVIVAVAEAPVVIAASWTAVVAVTSPSVMLNVSSSSTTSSPLIVTLIECVSPSVPAKVSGLDVVTV